MLTLASDHVNPYLAPEHRAHVFDHSGNADGTAWLDGRVGLRRDGSVALGWFGAAGADSEAAVLDEVRRPETFSPANSWRPASTCPSLDLWQVDTPQHPLYTLSQACFIQRKRIPAP